MKSESADILRIDGHDIRVTNPGKVLFPQDGITKADLIRYYELVGARMLPQLDGRPLTLQRFPEGIGHPGFIQKAAGRYFPEWIVTATVKKAGGSLRQVVCENRATLAYLAGQACITPHITLSRADRAEIPDQMIFDLDPPAEDILDVVECANLLKEMLAHLGLPAFVKSTGSRGLHVAVPLKGREGFDSVRALARWIGNAVAASSPERYTLEQRKQKRQGRVYIDVQRNGYGQTVVANYAIRARAGAPVAIPLHWADLKEKSFRPDRVTISRIQEFLDRGEDPWRDFWRQAVPPGSLRRTMEKIHAA